MSPDQPALPSSGPPTAVAPLIERILQAHAGTPGALLPVLHAIQDRLGHVPADAVGPVARALHLSRAEVHGVLTYYHHFRTAPPARHVLQVCRAESCRACGSDEIHAHATGLVAARQGRWALETVYCLGMCAASPAVQIDDRIHARVTPQSLDALIAMHEGAVHGQTQPPVLRTALRPGAPAPEGDVNSGACPAGASR